MFGHFFLLFLWPTHIISPSPPYLSQFTCHVTSMARRLRLCWLVVMSKTWCDVKRLKRGQQITPLRRHLSGFCQILTIFTILTILTVSDVKGGCSVNSHSLLEHWTAPVLPHNNIVPPFCPSELFHFLNSNRTIPMLVKFHADSTFPHLKPSDDSACSADIAHTPPFPRLAISEDISRVSRGEVGTYSPLMNLECNNNSFFRRESES